MVRKFLIAGLVLIAAGLYLVFRGGEELPRVADPDSQRFTTSGELIGFADRSNTHAWLGIPYASAPVGTQRWRAPLLAEPWSGVREALHFGAPCPQLWTVIAGVEGADGEVVGSEDCLSLNIWAPRLQPEALPEVGSGLPVMVWIHGGGNTVGSAAIYPAPVLAGRQQVVVVSINYRLGLLGWFSHPALRNTATNPRDGSGNYGTLDMIAALKWVQNNIAFFGGDPDRVTIFGESAGGRDVYSLMASPLAKGLFHRVISQSGSATTQPISLAENYAIDGGSTNSSRETLLRLLRDSVVTGDPRKVLEAMNDTEVIDFLRSRSTGQLLKGLAGSMGMYPAPQTLQDGVVLPREPLLELFSDPSRYNAVPLMTGTNRDEQKIFMALDPRFADQWFGIIPRIDNQAGFDRLAAYYSDLWRLVAVDRPATVITASGGAPVFAYRWDWDEGGSNLLVDLSTALGAAHGLEIAFVLGDFEQGIPIPFLFNEENRSGREQLSRQMMNYWGEFARSGDPGRGTRGDQPDWSRWDAGAGGLMLLDSAAGGGIRMLQDRMRVAAFKQRLFDDEEFAELRNRCAMYVELFNSPTRGRELWDEEEYQRLGCSAYDPDELQVEL
jgi:para-nitrobenzyl esterase